MSFVQPINCRTSRYPQIRDLDTTWQKATEGPRTLRRKITTRDHEDTEHYEVFCFFDSYDQAMVNSSLRETTATAARYAELLEGPAQFIDLDVIQRFLRCWGSDMETCNR